MSSSKKSIPPRPIRIYSGEGPDLEYLEKAADQAVERSQDYQEAVRRFAERLASNSRLRLAAAHLAVIPAWNEGGVTNDEPEGGVN